MRHLLTIAVIAGLAWYGYTKYQRHSPAAESSKKESAAEFKCDGRTHCSQMTSCAEAAYFINHCPGTRMDGDNDGIPCEKQWCGR